MYRVTIQNVKNLPELVPAAAGLLLQLPTDQAGWRNILNVSQLEVFTILNGLPVVNRCLSSSLLE